MVELSAAAAAGLNDFLTGRNGDVRVVEITTGTSAAAHARPAAAAADDENVHEAALMDGH